MKVSGFMVPAEKVVSVTPADPVRKVMDLMLTNKIGALVVMPEPPSAAGLDSVTELPLPIGIITKSDVMRGYQNRVDIDESCTAIMYKGDLAKCTANLSRDKAAAVLEKNHFHHLVVTDEKHEKFLGLLSSWDITAECARDDRAWPWPRSEDGKFHIFKHKVEATARSESPQTAGDHPTIVKHDHGHEEFETYMDDLDLMGFQ
uniref:CBS domain-containing protein n=1 Tax=Amphora coffeiformis TaxID=265554 RepID=A0A7S3KWV4_9STRA|mmetsp:Transcript_17214/g.34656  ORF Transcript_17214/g.34656 Transcript_17214/m.34656 type:complete len:203 (+) Transcript_17214:365-973(+)|eukprot:scaffold1127_cov160-Amphora_coffeaeformis.AAC.9